MTTKKEVNLTTYNKKPRLLVESMEHELGVHGDLQPILSAVFQDNRLRLEIRERRFNVYYRGGNLLLVDDREDPWGLKFDKKYFKGGGLKPPCLPNQFSGIKDSQKWVQAFPDLIAAMDNWWTRHHKDERSYCQAIATANSSRTGLPSTDYFVLDLEYQWAQRRFDMVAAKRKPTKDDADGWMRPELAFVEVKSDYGSCKGASGLRQHAEDFKDIITAGIGNRIQDIKSEFENIIAQKIRLGLIDKSLPFTGFSPTAAELLVVFVDLDPKASGLIAPIKEVIAVANTFANPTCIRFMKLASPNYIMLENATFSP